MSKNGWSLTTTGGDFTGLAEEAMAELRPRAERAVDEASDLLVDAVQAELKRSRGGPAPEGQPPAYESGELHDSIEKVPVKWLNRFLLSGGAESELEQAARLEFGGTDSEGRRILPHPYFRAAGEKVRAKIERILEAL